ncbi:hypothetical protein OE88DRAFT_1649487, partial [Heliocybe sulcata]
MLPSAPQSVPAAARMPIQSTEFKRPPAYFDTKLGERYLLYDPAQGSTHPQWKYGKAVVILLVTSEGHTTEKMKQYKARMVPVGAKAQQEVEDIRWVCLHPDTDTGLNADPDEDEIQAWVTDGRFLVHHQLLRNPDILEHIGEVSNKALRPVEDRTSNPPSGGKTPQGGIALERLLRRMSNDPGNAQVPEEDDVRSQLLQTLTEYAGSAMNAGPECRIDLLENIGLVKQMPPLGHRNNRRFWTGFQANVSRPILSNNSTELKDDLGRAGDAHPDSHDQIGSFSALIVANNTPPGYTHAHFHLIELGLFIVMERETAI